MFDRIDSILRDIEDIEQEIKILLNMHKLTLVDYIMIKRCSMDYPAHLKIWMIEQIDVEVDKLKLKIDELNKVKKEFLIW